MLGEEGEVLSSPRGRLRGGSGLRAGFKPYTKTPATRDSVIPFTTFQEHPNCEAASVRREHYDHDANIITWERASLGIECVKKVRKKQILWLVMRRAMMADVRSDALSRSLGAVPGKSRRSHLVEEKPEGDVTSAVKIGFLFGRIEGDVRMQE